MFVIRIFSRRHYAATQAEFSFQGVRRLLFKCFPGTTMLPQRQNSPFRDRDLCYSNLFKGTTMLPQRQNSHFRDRYVCYSNLFKALLCCHKGRIPISGIDMFVIRIFSRRHYAATKTEFPFQG